MTNFHDLNVELAEAQTALEAAEHALLSASSSHKKAKLEEKLYTTRVNTLQEKARNYRKEASI